MTEKAMRFNTGKVKLSYIVTWLFNGLARVMEQGGLKYKRGNWLKGGEIDQYIDSMTRHLQSIQLFWETGCDDPRLLYDVESWLPHIDHIAFNVIALRLALMRHPSVKMSNDPKFNTVPVRCREDINVQAFLDFMKEKYPNAKSEYMDMILRDNYNFQQSELSEFKVELKHD